MPKPRDADIARAGPSQWGASTQGKVVIGPYGIEPAFLHRPGIEAVIRKVRKDGLYTCLEWPAGEILTFCKEVKPDDVLCQGMEVVFEH